MLICVTRLTYIDGLKSVCEQAMVSPCWTLRLLTAWRYGLQNGATAQAVAAEVEEGADVSEAIAIAEAVPMVSSDACKVGRERAECENG